MPALRKKPAARDPAVRMARFAALRALANRLYGTATGRLRWLLITLIVGLAGCATSGRTPDPMPPVYVSERTWWQVDSDILAASRAAMIPAGNDARRFMENWRSRVHKRGEADFIPWFTGYWTQQWLAIKVAWYKLGAGEGKDPAAQRLAAYLQEQYRERVLEPVAREINPEVIRAKATQRYVRLLGEQLQAIPRRYGVPPEQFDRRLEDIPAIALAPPAAHNASLYQVVHADPLDTLPAVVALTAHIRKAAGGAGGGPSDARISPVAKRASERLVARLATSGGASAAAAAVGGVAGVVISLGAAGFGAIRHEQERPEMEAQLRESLDAALDDLWHSLMEDPATGVMAGVHHLSEQLEGRLAQTLAQPVELHPAPQEIPLASEPPVQEEEEGVEEEDIEEEALPDEGLAAE
jgi:hypothetical protein